jgi:hypothetical protein
MYVVIIDSYRQRLDKNHTTTPVSSTNKTDRHDITEISLKVALNTIKQTNKH